MVLVTLLLYGDVCSAQADRHPASGPITVNQVLSWLPADTETIIGASGPLRFPETEEAPQIPGGEPSAAKSEAAAVVDLPLFLFQLRSGGLGHSLNGKQLTLAIEGSRHFRSPAAIGSMRYEGCTVAIFDNSTPIEADKLITNISTSAKRLDKIAGQTVAVFEEEVESDIWTTFVAFPGKNIVAVATNADYLRTVLTRMSGTQGPKALPASLPEWKYVNTHALVWGLRHYDRGQSRLDPTSPFRDRSAANVPDALAVGLAFFVQSSDSRETTLTYLSGNKGARKVLESYLGGQSAATTSSRFRQPTVGAIQASISLSAPDGLAAFIFGLSAMLGHAIFV